MDQYLALENMIKQQLRTCDVLDNELLDVIRKTPRAHFVPEAYKSLAYADEMLPIGHDQTMMLPSQEAQMLQALTLKPHDKVLEIGTGTGYITALLARMTKQVYSVDIFPDFSNSAREKLNALQIYNAQLVTADAALGWDVHAPYDVIVITGSLPYLPRNFLDALKPRGRLFAIVGLPPAMHAVLYTRVSEEKVDKKVLFETNVKPLIHAPEIEHFSL